MEQVDDHYDHSEELSRLHETIADLEDQLKQVTRERDELEDVLIQEQLKNKMPQDAQFEAEANRAAALEEELQNMAARCEEWRRKARVRAGELNQQAVQALLAEHLEDVDETGVVALKTELERLRGELARSEVQRLELFKQQQQSKSGGLRWEAQDLGLAEQMEEMGVGFEIPGGDNCISPKWTTPLSTALPDAKSDDMEAEGEGDDVVSQLLEMGEATLASSSSSVHQDVERLTTALKAAESRAVEAEALASHHLQRIQELEKTLSAINSTGSLLGASPEEAEEVSAATPETSPSALLSVGGENGLNRTVSHIRNSNALSKIADFVDANTFSQNETGFPHGSTGNETEYPPGSIGSATEYPRPVSQELSIQDFVDASTHSQNETEWTHASTGNAAEHPQRTTGNETEHPHASTGNETECPDAVSQALSNLNSELLKNSELPLQMPKEVESHAPFLEPKEILGFRISEVESRNGALNLAEFMQAVREHSSGEQSGTEQSLESVGQSGVQFQGRGVGQSGMQMQEESAGLFESNRDSRGRGEQEVVEEVWGRTANTGWRGARPLVSVQSSGERAGEARSENRRGGEERSESTRAGEERSHNTGLRGARPLASQSSGASAGEERSENTRVGERSEDASCSQQLGLDIKGLLTKVQAQNRVTHRILAFMIAVPAFLLGYHFFSTSQLGTNIQSRRSQRSLPSSKPTAAKQGTVPARESMDGGVVILQIAEKDRQQKQSQTML